MSGKTYSWEFQQKKRAKLAAFQKEMDKYGLKVSNTAAVLSTSYPNTVNLYMTTEVYPVRGHSTHIKQLKAAGYWVSRWRETKATGPQKSFFQVNKVIMIETPDNMGVRA